MIQRHIHFCHRSTGSKCILEGLHGSATLSCRRLALSRGHGRRTIKLIISTENPDQVKRERGFDGTRTQAHGAGIGGLVRSCVLPVQVASDADDTKARPGRELTRRQPSHGSRNWQEPGRARHPWKPRLSHAKEKGADHKRRSNGALQGDRCGQRCLWKHSFRGRVTRWFPCTTWMVTDLRMTHYCAAGNQPRVKLDRVNSRPNELIFVFDGGTNFDPQKDHHIHGLTIKFHEDGKVTSAWESYAGGKKDAIATFVMTRQHDSEDGLV